MREVCRLFRFGTGRHAASELRGRLDVGWLNMINCWCGRSVYKVLNLVWMLTTCMRWIGFLSMTYETASASTFTVTCISHVRASRQTRRKVRERSLGMVFTLHSQRRRIFNTVMFVPAFVNALFSRCIALHWREFLVEQSYGIGSHYESSAYKNPHLIVCMNIIRRCRMTVFM
jgi:hypothetical protein